MDYVADNGFSAELTNSRSIDPIRTIPKLSALERSVVDLSHQDSLASIPDLAGWRAIVARWLRGEQPNRLANERLEALRRYAIIFRVRGEADGSALAGAGFTTQQRELVQQMVLAKTAAQRTKQAGVMAWLVLLILGLAIYAGMQAALEEPVISLLVAGVGLATLASIAAPRDHSAR